MKNWVVEKIPELSGYTVEWAEPGKFYLSSRNELFYSPTLKPPFERIATIDAPFWKRIASNFRIAQRLLRFMVTNIIPLRNGDLFVTFDKSVGVVNNGRFQVLKGLVRPCRVLRSACAIDAEGNIFFGEYLANKERGEIRIYKYTPGNDALEIVYVFPPKSIRHIHGLYFDPYTNSIFCLTGDAEEECKILRSFDGFKTMEVIGQGDETWRAVSILFDENYFYYGTDAEFLTNRIFKVDRRTFERKTLGEVNGTVFYSKKLGGNLFFGTTAENAPSQTENVATLWLIGEDEKCRKIASFKKDFYPQTLFMFGIIHFPFVNDLQNELYFYLVGVEEDDQTFKVKFI